MMVPSVEFHETDEVFDRHLPEHRRRHGRSARRKLAAGLFVVLMCGFEADAAISRGRRADDRVHRLRRLALGKRAPLQDLPEHDPKDWMGNGR